MSDQTQTLRDDITFLRRVAEQGRRGPVFGGAFILAAGIVYGAACALQWAIVTRNIVLPAFVNEYLWYGASAIFAAVWFALFFGTRGSAKECAGSSNLIFAVAWSAAGLGIMVASIAMAFGAAAAHASAPYALYPTVDFAFYGTAWFIIAALVRRAWMWSVMAMSFAASLLLASIAGDPASLLAMGVALVATLCVPGLLLMRESATLDRAP